MVKDLSVPPSPLPGPKRFRTPRTVDRKVNPIIHVDPVLRLESEPSTFEETLQLTDSDTSDSEVAGAASASAGLRVPSSKDDLLPDDLSKDLAELHQLRRNVKKNLQLRPIRSRSNLPKVNLALDDVLDSVIPRSPFATSHVDEPRSATSPTSAVSSYFTPVDVTPFSAVFSANSTNPPAVASYSPTHISSHSLRSAFLSQAPPPDRYPCSCHLSIRSSAAQRKHSHSFSDPQALQETRRWTAINRFLAAIHHHKSGHQTLGFTHGTWRSLGWKCGRVR
jgi:hypothetical protein